MRRSLAMIASMMLIAVPSWPATAQQVRERLTAIIDAQKGLASLKNGDQDAVTTLKPEKNLGLALSPGQRIRCEKNCRIELKLCTGNRVALEEEDGWYRVPALDCEKAPWVPGFKNTLMPAGRRAQNGPLDENEVKKASGFFGAITSIQGAVASTSIPDFFRELSSRSCPATHEGWEFDYPREGDVILPDLFTFFLKLRDPLINYDIEVRINFLISDESGRANSILSENFRMIKGIATLVDGKPFSADKARQALREQMRSRRVPAFLLITVKRLYDAYPLESSAKTFGYEVFLTGSRESTKLAINLGAADAETGITGFLAKAEILERLGMWPQAIREYESALQLSPENEMVRDRIEVLRKSRCNGPQQ